MQRLVSVIMPAYNAEKYLEESIGSVLNQTFTNWELLIINDGSTDHTEQILRSYNDPRIKIISQVNKGVSNARNKALEQMQGKYFTFLDADDILPINSLQLRVSFAEQHPEVDIVAGGVVFWDQKKVQRIWYPKFRGDPFSLFIRNDEKVFCNPALFIRRKSGISYEFKEGMTHVEDLLFFSSITYQAPHHYDYVNDIVYHYRISCSSAMNNLESLEKGYWTFFDSVKKMRGVTSFTKRHLKWRIFRIMFLSYLTAKKPGRAFNMLSKVFK